MKSLKSKRIFVLICIALSLSALASIYMLVQGINNYQLDILLFWVMVVRLMTMGILLTMSLSLWKIVKRYTEKSNWEPQYYQKVRQIGFWAIALTLFNPVFEMGMFITIEPLSKYSTDFLLGRFLLSIVMESPGMWVLSLSIFLFAELLQVANQVKTENESFI